MDLARHNIYLQIVLFNEQILYHTGPAPQSLTLYNQKRPFKCMPCFLNSCRFALKGSVF